jgi:hypothetical protein
MLKLGSVNDESLTDVSWNQLTSINWGGTIEIMDVKKQTASQRWVIHTRAFEKRSFIFKTARRCNLFYSAINISDYIASNGRMTGEWRTGKGLEGNGLDPT